MSEFRPILLASEEQQDRRSDLESRWATIERMMKCNKGMQAELIRRFLRRYAEEIAGK